MDLIRTRKTSERGVVLVVVLIIASIFAILAYTVLAMSIQSLEATDTHRHAFIARQVAEGGMHEAAYALLIDPEHAEVGFIDPVQLSTSEDFLRADLLSEDTSAIDEIDTFPLTNQITAYTYQTDVSLSIGDNDIIPGDRDNATYRYHNDTMFSEDNAGYEFAHVRNPGELVIFSAGEVDEPDGDTALFSFLRGEYPQVQWNYDVREAGVTEESRIGPYPYIETDHPYGPDQARMWSVTYQQDPGHTGRNITSMQFLAKPDQVQIDQGDRLIISGWLETDRRFQKLPWGEILDENKLGITAPYTNGPNEAIGLPLPTTTLGLYFGSNGVTNDSNYEYGFRVNGVRYGFDSDLYMAYYETPHPYDHIVEQTNPISNYNIQVIYSTYQASSIPLAATQQMRIQFTDDFSLDPGDTLYLFNASDDVSVWFVDSYTSASPPPPGGWSSTITRSVINPSPLPLGFLIILARNSSTDTDGVPDYGYKVGAMEYTGAAGGWNTEIDPKVHSPHNEYLGHNNQMYNMPAIGDPNLPNSDFLVSYQTIWQPAVPDTTNLTGLGTLDNWYVQFSGSCNLSVTGLGLNSDRIRLTTPGNPLSFDGLSDTIYFVHELGGLGGAIDNNNYYDIIHLKGRIVNCGTAPKLEIEFESDTQAEYENSVQNFGYRVDLVGYTTSDGYDDDATPPTVRSDMNFPNNTSYPAFGDRPYQYAEWWYSNDNPSQHPLMVGLHFDRNSYDLDPGDRLEIYDVDNILIATLLSDSMEDTPDAGGPENPDDPSGGQQAGGDPEGGGPDLPVGTAIETIVDLNATSGWVLIPGSAAYVRLLGDGDNNAGHAGFEIDHCGYINGDLLAVKDYAMDYTEVAYEQYYDRSAQGALDAFRNLGGH